MDLVKSLVESYTYMDMYQRGGEDPMSAEKVYNAGLPVNQIVSSVGNGTQRGQSGGKSSFGDDGPFAHKAVPAGLVLIHTPDDPNVEYENHFHPGARREVLSDNIFDRLIASVSPSLKKRMTPKRHKPAEKTRRKHT